MRIKRRREYKWWISKEPLRTSGVKPDVPGKPPGAGLAPLPSSAQCRPLDANYVVSSLRVMSNPPGSRGGHRDGISTHF